VVKVMCHKVASPPHTDGSVVFVRLRQCTPHLIHGSVGPPYSNPNCISVGSAVFAGLTIHRDRPSDGPLRLKQQATSTAYCNAA